MTLHSPVRTRPVLPTLALPFALLFFPCLRAQPTAPAPARPDAQEASIVLSPFEVVATSDTGYEVNDSNSSLKIAVDVKNLPYSLSVLSSNLLRDFAALNENEALRLNASVNATENFITKSQNRPFIRGTSSVRVYTDGLFMNSLQTPSVAVDRVEILKGTSGMLFGLGEPGGTLNYVFKPALAKARTTATAGFGSWGERFAQLDAGGPLSSDGRLTSRIAAGHQSGEAYTENTRFETRELYVRLRYAFARDTTLQLTLAHSNRTTDAPAYLQWDGFAGRHMPTNEATNATRYAPFGTDPVASGLLNRYSNTNTPDSFADVLTNTLSAEFNHRLSARWWLRAAAARTHMGRDSLIVSAFSNSPVGAAGTTLAPSPTTGLPVATPTARGDLLASPTGQLAYDDLASEAVQFNVLGEFEAGVVSWKTVFGADYNREVFYGDRWRSSWWYAANASQRAATLPAAQRVQPVVANLFAPEKGWNMAVATPPLSTFTVPDGNFTNTTRGPGYYWINHVKLWADRLVLTGSGRRDFDEMVNQQFLQLSRTSLTTGRADQAQTTYSVGGVCNVNKRVSLFANQGTTFRPQVTVMVDKSQTYRMADPITGSGGDVGFRLEFPERHLRLSAGVCRVLQSNLVVNKYEQQPDGTTLNWQEQSGENEVKGYECEVSVNPLRSLSLNLSYAYLDSRVKSNFSAPAQVGQELAQTPDNTFVLVARWIASPRLTLGGSVNVVRDERLYVSVPNNDPRARTYVGNYASGDLFLTYVWRLPAAAWQLRTQLNVYNVTNRLYASEFGLSKPRSFRLSTSLSW